MTVGKILLVLLGIWILMGVIGFLIKGLFVLFIIACVAFGFTLAGEGRRRGVIGGRRGFIGRRRGFIGRR